MTIQQVNDLNTPFGDILQAVGTEGLLLTTTGPARYALLPLDEDLLDYLLERNPKLIEDCRQIRQQMDAGQFHSQDEVKKLLASE